MTYESSAGKLLPVTVAPMLQSRLIRHDLRPGDLGSVAALHGRVYAVEYRLDTTFEAHVAGGLAAFGDAVTADPDAGRLWVAEHGALIGSIAVTRTSPTLCHLRWFCLARHARGQGLGRRMLDGALAYARDCGYDVVELETFSELKAAAHLYTDAGFELVDSQPMLRWGSEIELRHYRLGLG